MRFGQLIEYNMRSIVHEKLYAKSVEGSIPSPFSKKIKMKHISGSIV